MLKIWRVQLDDPAHLHPSRLACLDQKETNRWQRLRKDAHRYAAAHTALRSILASELMCLPSDIQYLQNPWGKPWLRQGLQFSLSHSGGLALIALQPDVPLGVDIELSSKDTDISWFSECWSPAELKRMQQPLSPEQALRLWVRKEAVLKALGRGLSLPMSQVVLPLGQAQRMRAMTVCEEQSALWHLYDLDVGQGQLAALASRRHYRPEALRVLDYLI
ncbi:4'-phosphopantetheinyl transferase superfamily protein [Iodobacter sp. CM08]|uniref:4'-phosphopantetheinyl transferase family protein n=1 Tax=Iodobacter sp. CM08 TaxID=3085902 RepID=UPI002982545F|nr:4'-phosphopantetheinyl transferase superfamily protein [Iodobacter sp. CM08]MDW5416257.1 4'-phosphopantetheinyl transferase superfamily protein [Iodobacter sp. CM08]